MKTDLMLVPTEPTPEWIKRLAEDANITEQEARFAIIQVIASSPRIDDEQVDRSTD